ncbi:MAG: universal stress protein [Anaerolineae bacterium]|nr:MAG: universal stress protein [Anaerolineae bacterium]
MFDSILVPLDGSQLAECVLPHAMAIARPFDSEISLLRMLEKNQTGVPGQLMDLLSWQINKTQASLYLEKARERLEESKLRSGTAVLEGRVAEGIAAYAQQKDIKLIILSSHGRSGLTPWGVSSVSQKIILSAPTSVLIVRAHQQTARADEPSETPAYPRILVPLDGSQRAENVLPAITQLARFHKSQIHLMHVIQRPEMARQMPPAPEDIELSNKVVERNREEAGRYLEEVKSRSSLDGIKVQTHLLTSDNACVELHRLVEQENIGLVAMNAHGHSGNQQWPYGSLVNNFILYGKVPLLILQDLPAKQESRSSELTAAERSER